MATSTTMHPTAPGVVGDSMIADTAEAAATAPSIGRMGLRPSVWSALWAALAFLYLAFARRTFGRLG